MVFESEENLKKNIKSHIESHIWVFGIIFVKNTIFVKICEKIVIFTAEQKLERLLLSSSDCDDFDAMMKKVI